MTVLSCQALDVAVAACVLVKQLNLQLLPGRITAVLGRNGTGKSLTLHTLAGLRAASGQVLLDTRSLQAWPRRERARTLAFVAQDIDEPFPASVLDCALSGRHPHLDFWQWQSSQDEAIARAALASVDLQHFSERNLTTLSGGERRRLAIATALTQQPKIFILDEPTNHLDPQHQLQVLKVLRAQADAGGTVLMSLHDPTLAQRFADDALLLFGDGRWLHGSVDSVLCAATLTELYHTPMHSIDAPQGRLFFNG